MIELLKDVELDLDRCERVLREKDYIEIVIAIEELQDKYRDKINCIGENESDVVWNYSQKDLKQIKKCLNYYKDEIILKEKYKKINEKLKTLEDYLQNNNISNKTHIKEIISLIENVNKDFISLDEKYEKLKSCFGLLQYLDREVSIITLELITLVIK